MTNKILAIDHGMSRIGLAISDSGQMIAMPYKRILNSADIIEDIKEICHHEHVEKVVVGLPLAMSGGDTEQTRIVRNFVGRLRSQSKLSIDLEDERLSSKMANRIFPDEDTDVQSAVIILQSYLDKNN